jgi:peptide chain release factor 1
MIDVSKELEILIKLQNKINALRATEISYDKTSQLKIHFKKIKLIESLLENLIAIKDNHTQIINLQDMLDDADLGKEAREENKILEEKILKLKEDFVSMLQAQSEEDYDEVILEIRSGTGGDEAAIFANDLLRMYTRYCEIKKWKIDILSISKNEFNGVKSCFLQVNGNNVFSRLKFESGVHRVQRIPLTEANGRIHTSTASVVILPTPDDIDIDVDMKDIRVDTYRAGGAGGQHVNKTESAIRLTHMPSGIVVQCQDERSQHENKARALKMLTSKLFEHKRQKQMEMTNLKRDNMIGSGDRSEKSRTYNYPQNRITDHLLNITVYNLDIIIEGNLDAFLEQLNEEHFKSKAIDLSNIDKLEIFN